MKNLQIISEQKVLGKDFKIYGTIEQPLFLAKEVAGWIEHSKPSMMLDSIDREEKRKETIFTSGQNCEMWFLTEDGLYEVLMQSKKPIAKRFKKKVKEILKDIRRHGMYAADDLLNNPDLLIKIATALKEEKEKKRILESEKQALQMELDYSKEWYSIKRVAALNGVYWQTFDWKELKAKSLSMGLDVKKIFDPNYGEVNTYHYRVWIAVYPDYEI